MFLQSMDNYLWRCRKLRICSSSENRLGGQGTRWFLWKNLFFSNTPYIILVPLHNYDFLIQKMVTYSVA